MGQRRHGDEIAFGSDSFLDVLANIVGILIILIVIAGVRVRKTPIITDAIERLQPDPAAVSAEPPPDQSPPDGLPQESPAVDDPLQDDARTASFDPVPSVDPHVAAEPPPLSADLVRAVEQRESHVRELQRRRDQLERERETLLSEQAQIAQRLSTARDALEGKQEALSQARLVLAEQEASLESQRAELATLQLTLADVKAAEPEPTVLKHRLTAVGRVVTGDQLHFLLSGNRVAFVPFDELAAEVAAHYQRKKLHIVQTPQYAGSIGPVRGFRMDFVIESQPLSIIEELRLGATGVRSGMTHWQIHPQSGVIAETAAQALHLQSRFLEVLRTADLGSTLTFWVYPDSFGLHRELQEFVHRQGFEVAARPLPDGVPIAASPQGSHSVAQ